ncbi:hypothetical protein H310_09446 [Aphanomyces invadans]|uniref:Uncharacterized protein n=1 Tax=Aphanomyces invadans TaxID=157072 RepID=A0A024TW11_9STRA|nr:hypothetical protein H310_09446 [Aphanomyces invadans]ETV97532.1 hypothetical protein H310_09446 [Aphanomyces invadans]|eukprot:XP_008873741.1 hypothetical protein H310_09446 [Aphanomyces invadans]
MTLNANFMTLQACMQEVIRAGGNNDYKIPHMKKALLASKASTLYRHGKEERGVGG